MEACKWQVLLYLSELKKKGIIRKGRIEFIEKKKAVKNTVYIELTEEKELQLQEYINQVEELLQWEKAPDPINKASCKKCSYYEYCYI